MEYRIFTGTEGQYKYFFTDHELFFGEMLAHSEADENGGGTVDFVAGLDDFLPQKADDYGYRQAHVEMLLCLLGSKVHLPKVVDYLNISGNEMIELMRMNSRVKYRVLIGTTIVAVRDIAAKAYIQGYKRGIGEIEKRMRDDGFSTDKITEMRDIGRDTIREMIRKFQPDDLYEEYMELYREIT